MIATVGNEPGVENLRPEVLTGRDMLVFSHDWTGDPLSKNHLMRVIARENRVLWVNSIGYRAPTISKRDFRRAFKKLSAATEPIREVEHNIFVLNPLVIPFHGSSLVRVANVQWLRMQVKRAMRKLGFKRPINWVFNPAAEFIAGKLGEETVIYYCVDEFSEFTGVGRERLLQTEEKLLRRADLVVVSAQQLYDAKAPSNPNTILIRHGVDHSHFCKALDPDLKVPDEIANLPRPIIGFFGLIADWVDVDLMARAARKYSSGSVVILGKETTDVSVLRGISNVHLLGRKPYESLPAYCKGFDVALNPFRINALTLAANPLKVREYLAAGLPVISTAIPEVELIGQCRIGRDDDGFLREIDLALQDPGPTKARSDAIRHESWEACVRRVDLRLAEMSRTREGAVK